jgi:photosystem I subunit X
MFLEVPFVCNNHVRLTIVPRYEGEKQLFTPTLLAVAVRAVDWSPNVAVVMIAGNVLAIVLAKLTVQKPNEGPAAPAASFFGGFSLGAVIGTLCLGHAFGAGAILGLTQLGAL